MHHFHLTPLKISALAGAVAMAMATTASAQAERVIDVSLPLGPDSQQGVG